MDNLLAVDGQQTKALLGSVQKFSELFWGPDRQTCGEMLSDDYWQSFKTLEKMLNDDLTAEIQKIENDLKRFSDENSLFQYLETAYVRLFISHRNGIAAPLYESCYVGAESVANAPLMGEPALLMKQRFESSGLALDSEIHEPPDHLAIELEYLYFLLNRGWADQDKALVAEARSFAAETMLPWVSKLQKRIAVQAPDHLYFLLVSILTMVLHRIRKL